LQANLGVGAYKQEGDMDMEPASAQTSRPPEPQLDAPPSQPEVQPEGAPQGHPTAKLEPAEPMRLDSDRDLSRIGFWSLGLGGIGVAVAITFLLAGGILPGALVIGLALLCALFGALILGLVAHHQG
jgi:hypothetical protein